MQSILIRDATIVTMDEARGSEYEVVESGYLLTEGERIAALGSGPPPDGMEAEKEIDGQGFLVMPGLVNAHTHAGMTLLRSFADDLPLMEWLNEAIWPAEELLTPEDIYWATKLAIAEMIRGGTTAFADMYFAMDYVARAVEETGMRAALSRGLIGIGPEAGEALAEAQAFVEDWRGECGRIRPMLGPHAPYTCPPEFMEKVLKIRDKLEVPLQIHVAETRDEVEDIEEEFGVSPVLHLMDQGVFSGPVLAAHCVHLSSRDIEILSECNVQIAHCPQSNMKLASGTAPVDELITGGVDVALGTDGAASNNNLDLFEEMRAAAFLQKLSVGDPTVLPAVEILRMVTVRGARALGFDDAGILRPGFAADVILIDAGCPHLRPGHNPHADLAYAAAASDVDTVIIAGRMVMENRRLLTIDEEEVFARIAERKEKFVPTE